MTKSELPLWFKQISYYKSNNIIENGLTIPYLVGSYILRNQPLNGEPISSLLTSILESKLEKCAVLQKCPGIHQYVIGIDDREFCERFMKKDIRFVNSLGKSSLFITLNACNLGNDIDKIIKEFNNLYGGYISESRFSWNKRTKDWEEFTESQKNLIRKIK